MPKSSTNWSSAFKGACLRMGNIPWTERQFKKHAQYVAPNECSYPEDVCISGAAGYRFDSAWEYIDRDMRPHAVRILQRYPTPGHEPEDLWATAVVKLSMGTDRYALIDSELQSAGTKPSAVILYAGKTPLFRYFITVAKRHAFDQTEKKSPSFLSPESASISNAVSPPPPTAFSADLEKVRKQLDKVMSSWTGEEFFLFESVFISGRTRKETAKLLGWDDAARATRWLQRLCSQINDTIDWDKISPTNGKDSEQSLLIVNEIRRIVQLGSTNPSEHLED